MFRRLGELVIAPYSEKSFNLTKYWPIAGDDSIEGEIRQTKEQKIREKLMRMKAEEKLKNTNGNTN